MFRELRLSFGMRRRLGIFFVACMAWFTPRHTADACTCEIAPFWMLSPVHDQRDVPLNAHVRVNVYFRMVRQGFTVHLRDVAGGEVPGAVRVTTNPGDIRQPQVELVPAAPLAPMHTYEVTFVSPTTFPSTRVVASFETGTAVDHAAPTTTKLMAPTLPVPTNSNIRSGCAAPDQPSLTFADVHSADVGRPNARLVYGLWHANEAGVIDAAQPPDAFETSDGSSLYVGAFNTCMPAHFRLPNDSTLKMGIAAIDESGNVGVMQRLIIVIPKYGPL
jgi:hypothetical protein